MTQGTSVYLLAPPDANAQANGLAIVAGIQNNRTAKDAKEMRGERETLIFANRNSISED
jgi:hypothetical protein